MSLLPPSQSDRQNLVQQLAILLYKYAPIILKHCYILEIVHHEEGPRGSYTFCGPEIAEGIHQPFEWLVAISNGIGQRFCPQCLIRKDPLQNSTQLEKTPIVFKLSGAVRTETVQQLVG